MKILDRYVLKSFLVPFFATFFIVLFVLVMQALWLMFDDIAGKGIGVWFILKFLYYTLLLMSPQALPIAVLLSSIMVMGNLSENYEFAASKSAGISLERLVRPLVILAIILSGVAFLFYNNVYPYAILKQKNMHINIKKKKPALALVAGSFNTDVPGYHIKFDEKYGKDKNLLKKVFIYDLTGGNGNQKVITAERGKIVSEEGSKYIRFILNDGYYYENHIKNNASFTERKKMPASNAKFKEYEFNIDISSLTKGDLELINFKNSHGMLTLGQIKDTLPDIVNDYDEFINIRAKNSYNTILAKQLYKYPDSLKSKNIKPTITDNFDLNNQITILNSAISKADRMGKSLKTNKATLKYKRKRLNLYEIEYYNRVALSLACLLLFFIGAPLGSIIRKGGFGLPMILAICIYVMYHFSNTFGRNLAEESSITAIFGSWVAAIIMTPVAILLTKRATKDMGLFNIDVFLQPVGNFFKKLFSKK